MKNKKHGLNYINRNQMIRTFSGQDVHVRRMPPKSICYDDISIEMFYNGFEIELEVIERIKRKYVEEKTQD